MSVSNLPSLETLAVELSIPALLRMATEGHTTESVSQMKYAEANENGITAEEYIRFKSFFKTINERNSPAADTFDASAAPKPAVHSQSYPVHDKQPTVVVIRQAQQPAVHIDKEDNRTLIRGGIATSLFFSPLLGLVAFLLGTRRERGAWLFGSGIGGIIHSIIGILIGVGLHYSAKFYFGLSHESSTSTSNSNLNSPEYYDGLARNWLSASIAFFVVGSLLVIICTAEMIVGRRMMNSKKIMGNTGEANAVKPSV